MEQMVVTSGINVQFEQMMKMVKPYEIPLKNPPTPKEFECLGFALANVNINFRKGYVELTCGYRKVQVPSDPKVCENFLNALRKGPKTMLNQATDMLGGKTAKEFLES